jgi:hypothetical protein
MQSFHGVLVAVLVSTSVLLAQQEGEKPVPKDSARVTLSGCATGRTFIVGPRSEHGASNLDIAPGRRFKMNGEKKLLEQIKAGEDRMVEITGVIRRADLKPQQGGVALAGGRVRSGRGEPRDPVGGTSVATSTSNSYNQVTIDLESSRALPDRCPAQ